MTEKEDIYNLGFDEIKLEVSNEMRHQFFNVGQPLTDSTIKYLTRKFKAYKVCVCRTTNPEKLKEIDNMGLKIVKVIYTPYWMENLNWQDFFLHYMIFWDVAEYNFYRLNLA